jgi:hypothetical protein
MKVHCWEGGFVQIENGIVLVEGKRQGTVSVFECVFVVVALPDVVVLATELRRVVGTDADEIKSVVCFSPLTGLSCEIEAMFADGGFFVSRERDLSALRPKGLSGPAAEMRSEFVFNFTTYALLGPLVSRSVIYGFVGASSRVQLVARRARHGCGVRFHKRGAVRGGDFGANFVEIEQITTDSNYVQLRGSVVTKLSDMIVIVICCDLVLIRFDANVVCLIVIVIGCDLF